MTPAWEALFRSIGTLVAFAVLGFLANASNLTDVVNPNLAYLIAGLAAAVLAAVDKAKSPDGTVGFGSIGATRQPHSSL